jgi:hypothetical protein
MTEKDVVLKVNGTAIPLNPFVKRLFTNVIAGLVDSLDKIPPARDKIEIIIGREEKK